MRLDDALKAYLITLVQACYNTVNIIKIKLRPVSNSRDFQLLFLALFGLSLNSKINIHACKQRDEDADFCSSSKDILLILARRKPKGSFRPLYQRW